MVRAGDLFSVGVKVTINLATLMSDITIGLSKYPDKLPRSEKIHSDAILW